MIKILSLIICFIVLMVNQALASTIFLESGRVIKGKIVSQTDDAISVDVGIDTPVTYYRDEIKHIVDEPVDNISEIATAVTADIIEQANRIENQGVVLIDQGNVQEGMTLMRQALTINPTPIRQLNYGSILFGNGASLFQDNQQEQAKIILKEAQEYLEKAVLGLLKGPQDTVNAPLLAQAYFLLGEISANAFNDAQKAKTYYQKSVEVFDHEPAKQALENLL